MDAMHEREDTMKTAQNYRIATIGGDGVGPEVTGAACRILEHIAALDGSLSFTFDAYPWGCDYYLETGRMMPEDGLDILRRYDAILLGAVGSPSVPDHVSLHGLLLAIRQGFDQYINLRPVQLLKGAPCPLQGVRREQIDMIFVRENTEGEYAGAGSFISAGKRVSSAEEAERAEQTAVFTREGCERVMRYAFELARSEGQTLTSISKANALNYSMVFWDAVFRDLAEEYPDVETKALLVDAAAMFMVREPERFGVVVCSNLFGDILTDLGAAIAGGMGLAAGANLNPEKQYPSMFEPVHGSAPDIAGKGLANPMASIWSAAQMLDHLGYQQWGMRIVEAIEAVLDEGTHRTPDLGGQASTEEVTEAVLRRLDESFSSDIKDATGKVVGRKQAVLRL